MKVGFAQFAPIFGDIKRNLEKISALVDQASDFDLLVFPELATSGYEFIDREELSSLSEFFEHGPTSIMLLDLAQKYGVTLVVGYPEKDSDKIYNSAMLVTPEGKKVNYRKLHLFSREKVIFDPGDAEPPVVQTPAGIVGLMICFDWIFPEVARILGLSGAQIIAHPSNLVLDFCQKAMFARSVENRVFSITANRIGEEERRDRKLTFTGQSQILGPDGSVLDSAKENEECLGSAIIDIENASNKLVTPYNPIFEDRRTEFYNRLLKK